jgi:trimeric autotransporter adhesin
LLRIDFQIIETILVGIFASSSVILSSTIHISILSYTFVGKTNFMYRYLLLTVAVLSAHFTSHVSAQSFSLLGSGCNDKVFAISGGQSGSSDVYAGGAFLNAGGAPVNFVAKWDGSAWSDLDNGVNFNVRSLLLDSNILYVGGGFNMAGSNSLTAWGIASWDGSKWSDLGNGVRGDVYAMEFFNNNLYAGGMFDTLSGFNIGRGILKWDGSMWLPLNGVVGDGVSGPPGFKVKTLKVFNGELYIGGSFDTAGGVAASNFAKWNGTSWLAVGSGMDGEVNAMTIYNNELYIGGDFTTADGVIVNGLAKLTGNTFDIVGGGVTGMVNGLTVYNWLLYATGSFTTAGAVTAQNIASWDGTNWNALGLGINFDGNALTPFNGDLYVGGFFSVAGTVFANNIAKYNMPVGINDLDIESSVSVGPVPSDGLFYLHSEHLLLNSQVEISDISGRSVMVFSNIDLNAGGSLPIDMSGYDGGIYFVKVSNSDVKATYKIVLN